MPADQLNRDRWRCSRDRHSASYDKQTQFFDRVLSPTVAAGSARRPPAIPLEVAISTGLNLPLYPDETRLTGIDLSPAMLGVARHRAEQVGRAVDLREADALALPFPDAGFDTVVRTFALCAIPRRPARGQRDEPVLRLGGLLLLADRRTTRRPQSRRRLAGPAPGRAKPRRLRLRTPSRCWPLQPAEWP